VTKLPMDWSDEISYHLDYQEGIVTGSVTSLSQMNSKTEVQNARINLANRYTELRSARRQIGVFMYVSLFAGMVVLVTMVSSLMVRQFYQVKKEKDKYRLLYQLGVSKRLLKHSVYQQNAWLFFPPLIIATAHGSVAIRMFTTVIQSSSYWLAYLFCVITMTVFVVAYLLTNTFCIRMIEEQ